MDLSETHDALEQWATWQNTAQGSKLSLFTSDEPVIESFDPVVAERVEKAMQALKVFSPTNFEAVKIYWLNRGMSTRDCAMHLRVSETKFRGLKDSGECYVAGKIC